MKRIILAALILFTSNAFAQTWVQVPDVNFQNYLTAHYPAGAFMTSGSDFFVDSDHADIQNEDSLNISNQNIVSIEGVTAFETLIFLNCSYNSIVALSDLPSSLSNLTCEFNQLSSLPDLPPYLQILDCGNNQITVLPSLPSSVTILNCHYNLITDLPALSDDMIILMTANNPLGELPVLPASLSSLYCASNQLTVLPDFPPSLTLLHCPSNQLTSIPELPQSMIILDFSRNHLSIFPDLPATLQYLGLDSTQTTELPPLPSGLIHLWCSYNELTELPSLPATMTSLTCAFNQLTELPTLPSSLKYLFCNNNVLSELPELPSSLLDLSANINQITCFPEFPLSLISLYIGDNLFTCLPNYIPAMDAATLAYPLCEAGNPNGCESASGIQGSVFNDVNNDCVDSGLPLIYVPMILNDDNGNLLTSSTNLVNGDYYFAAGPGDYAVEVNTITLSPAVQVNCPVANELTATVTVADPVVDAGDFGLACAGFDLGVQSVVPTGWIFPGQTHSLNILAGDLTAQYNMHCATGISGDVTIAVSGPGSVTFGGTPTSVSGNTATYSLSDYGALDANLFSASVLTDSTANAGDEFCVSVTVTTAASGDVNSANNTYNFCYQVVNSYDPNIKLTTPELVDPGYEDEFTYTIYFQNTGNAPAFNIRLADTLDSNLDLTTLKFVNGSHAFTTSLSADSRLLNIRFPNIMLPDSTTDAEGSIGFIQYRAKPVSGLPNGTIIRNTAYIYFDFNAPIVTNTSENRFSSVGLNELSETKVKVYPNPATTTVVFESDEAIEQLEFYDLNGTKVKALQPKVQKTQVDVSYLQNGVYIVKVYSETGVTNKRLVVSQ